MPELFPIAKGMATFVLAPFRSGKGAAGGSVEAPYCHTVYLRHLDAARRAGMPESTPVVAELGPGLSLGTGLVAVLRGAQTYLALDVVRDAAPARNVAVLDELVDLVERRVAPAGDDRYPGVAPHLGARTLPPMEVPNDLRARRDAIAAALRGTPSEAGPRIEYRVPWSDPAVITRGSVDHLFAQAVLEHVNDPPAVYRAMAAWLRPGGYVTATVDFRSHGLTKAWNGHWSYPDALWTIVAGRRSWGLNRSTWAEHAAAIAAAGLELKEVIRDPKRSALTRDQLAPRFATISEEDLNTKGVFFVARRPD